MPPSSPRRARHRAPALRWRASVLVVVAVVAAASVLVATTLLPDVLSSPVPPPGGSPAATGPTPAAAPGPPAAEPLPPWRSGATTGLGTAVPDPPATSPLVPRPDLTVFYAALDASVDAAELDRRAGGATLVLTLEPYDFSSGGTDQPRYRLARITDGSWDEQLGAWAREVAAMRSPVMVRFAHEMNGTWYPWSEQTNGNAPGEYVDAWRHVVDLFRSEGATQALWVWSPNVSEEGTAPLDGLWPGADHVDAVGLDGYNWGTTRPDTSWRSPDQVFGATLAQVRLIAPGVPVMITETASAEAGGDKAAWVRGLFSFVRRHDLSAVVWFAYDKEADWRPDSSRRSEKAFEREAAALSTR